MKSMRKSIIVLTVLAISSLSFLMTVNTAFAVELVTSIVGGPSGVTVDTSSDFTFIADQVGSTFQCRIDLDSFAPCVSPFTTPDLGVGLHVFQVRATNPELETESSPVSRTWAINSIEDGDGSEAHPFTISTCNKWLSMADNLDAYYELTSDVDCGSTVYDAIGTEDTPFTGTLNGNGYEISAVVYIGFNSDCILYNCNTGLFGKIAGATISNLVVNNSTFTGEHMVGTIAGTAFGSQISDVIVFGNVELTGFGSMGGLVGFADETVIENSAFLGNITQTTAFDMEVGGLVGSLVSSNIVDSYADADISSLGGGVGGIAGRTAGHDDIRPTINRSYSYGSITSGEQFNGGLVGTLYYGDVTNSFSVTDMTGVSDGLSSGKLFGIFRASLATQTNNYYNIVGSGPLTCASDEEDTPVCEAPQDLGFFLGLGNGNDLFSTWFANDPWNLNEELEYPTFAIGNLECNDPTDQSATSLHYECTFFREMNEQYSGDEVSKSIRYKVEGSDDEWTYVDWSLDTNNFEINNLKPATQYRIQVHVAYEIGASDWASNYIIATTPTLGDGDFDGDGAKDSDEYNAPLDGDINGDSILDINQNNVATFVNPVTGKYVSVVVPDTCALTNVGANREDANSSLDGLLDYSNGLVNFTANCGVAGVTIPVQIYYFEPGVKAKDIVARKYTSYNKSYQNLDGASLEDLSSENGDILVRLSYSITDGSALDNDQLANGIIVDPVGLASLSAITSTPATSLSDTGANSTSFVLYALLILSFGVVLVAMIRKKRFIVK